jgi:hypothetical protein
MTKDHEELTGPIVVAPTAREHTRGRAHPGGPFGGCLTALGTESTTLPRARAGSARYSPAAGRRGRSTIPAASRSMAAR